MVKINMEIITYLKTQSLTVKPIELFSNVVDLL